MIEVLSSPCPACGSQNRAGARYCSNCGARADGNGQAAVPVLVRAQSIGVLCERCHERTVPIPYFARGANIAKAMLLTLTPFTVVGPVLFFLWRKDRFICTRCHRLLSVESPVGFLDAFSTETRLALGAAEAALQLGNGAAASRALVRGQLSQEIELLERKVRRRRGRAWTLGILSGVFGVAGLGAAATMPGAEVAVTFFSFSALSGVGTLLSAVRSSTFGRLAEAKRRRQRMFQIVELARVHQGRLNVTLVASHLHLDFQEAESALDTLVDGRRVDLDVDDEGRVTYVFPELIEGPASG